MEGWFSIDRKLLESELWLCEKFTRGQAWCDLIGLANHTDGWIIKRGIQIEIKRGQCGWSQVRLGQRWMWSRKKVDGFLKWLEKEQQITQQKNNENSIITICKYEEYQNKRAAKDTTNGAADVAAKEQQKSSKRYTNNNGNNVNNEKNTTNVVRAPIEKIYLPESIEIELSKLLYEKMLINNPKVKTPDFQKWAAEVDKMFRLDSRTKEEIEIMILWSQQDNFWKANILSMKKLREKFDSLFIKAKSQYEKEKTVSIPSFENPYVTY